MAFEKKFVWIATRCLDYEGDEVLLVAESVERAVERTPDFLFFAEGNAFREKIAEWKDEFPDTLEIEVKRGVQVVIQKWPLEE